MRVISFMIYDSYAKIVNVHKITCACYYFFGMANINRRVQSFAVAEILPLVILFCEKTLLSK